MGVTLDPSLTPERREEELDALATAGIVTVTHPPIAGLETWDCTLTYKGSPAVVNVSFVDGFPWVAPLVASNEPILERHQVPVRGGSFCLDRSDAPWWTPEHSVADLLAHLQRLLDADADGSIATTEAEMTEPASVFLSGDGFPLVLLTETPLNRTLGATEGTLTLTRVAGREPRWIVTDLRANDGIVRLKTEAAPVDLTLEHRRAPRVRWKDLGEIRDRPGVERARGALLDAARATPQRTGRGRQQHQWHAVTFLEEGPQQGQTRRAWAFAHVNGSNLRFATTQALTIRERGARRRDLDGLGDARVVLVGAGSVGSIVALQVAQAGVRHIDIVDGDRFDINNGVRHILPASAMGQHKATALADYLNAHQPFCESAGHVTQLGHTPGGLAAMTALVREADIVIDATGSLTLSRMLGQTAYDAGVPALHVGLLSGRGHGFVFVRRPGTGCIDHFLKASSPPFPEDRPLANATPYGCSHPAVSSAPFESAELGVHAARVAAQVLPTAAYSSFDHDWLVTRPIADGPAERGHLPAVETCPYCHA